MVFRTSRCVDQLTASDWLTSVLYIWVAGPVLPEQPPTQWDARSSDLVTGELKGRVLRAVLVNDFIAIGLGLKALPPDDLVTLHDAPAEPNAPIACVGAGTGLGEVRFARTTAWSVSPIKISWTCTRHAHVPPDYPFPHDSSPSLPALPLSPLTARIGLHDRFT
jgi:hypothetical protein